MQETNSDVYELALDEALKSLKECQEAQNLKSCFLCEKLYECEIRKNYIDKVYESMAKGEGGGFEF